MSSKKKPSSGFEEWLDVLERHHGPFQKDFASLTDGLKTKILKSLYFADYATLDAWEFCERLGVEIWICCSVARKKERLEKSVVIYNPSPN